jgi:hypothetical protein
MYRILAIVVAALLAGAMPSLSCAGQPAKLTATDSAIISAAAAMLSGRKAVRSVVFEDAAMQALTESKLRDPTFALHRFQLIARDPNPVWPNTTSLGVYLQFVGSAGRRFRMTFVADFTQTGRTVVVRHASVLPVYAPAIVVRPLFALVPSAKLHLDLLSSDTTFAMLAEFADRNAVRLDPTGRNPPAPGKYYAFAFFTERLRESERIAFRQSISPKTQEGSPVRAWRLNQDGWRAVVAPVQIDEKNTASIFLKAVIATKGNDNNVTERLAGVLRLSRQAK